jgi:hypothetical protein
MDLMIIAKWNTSYDAIPGGEGQKAPAIITQMVNMFLKGGEVDGEPLIGSDSTMVAIQITILSKKNKFYLIVVAFVSVPLMLFVKPCTHKSKPQPEHIDSEDKS